MIDLLGDMSRVFLTIIVAYNLPLHYCALIKPATGYILYNIYKQIEDYPFDTI